ncbi:MAG: Gfo/Idh/MocA family oxidoreductase [Victivallaceae bacterium]
MKKLNFAVIGCGALAQMQHIPNLAKSAKARLHTCCDLSDESLALCRERYGAATSKDWRAVIADPAIDAICLATTEKLRLPVIECAAANRKPIYVEKPLATTLEEVYRIQQVVKSSGIPFCVGHNRRNSPAMIDARRIFRAQMAENKQALWRWNREPDRPHRADDGRASMNVRINDDWYSWKNWVFDPAQAPHGPMLFEMTHFTDLCNWFLAAEPEEVVAMETGMLNHAIIIKYRTGELATLNLCANGTFGYPKELYEMMGNGALVAVDHMCEVRTAGIPGAPALLKYPFLNDRHANIGVQGGIAGWLEKKAAACAEAAATGDPARQFTAEPDKGHAHALEHFIDQINGLRGEVCGVDDAVSATRVAFAAIKSAREKRIVKLSEI